VKRNKQHITEYFRILRWIYFPQEKSERCSKRDLKYFLICNLMKSIKWSLLITAALALLVFSVTIQQQDVAAPQEGKFVINNHAHTSGIHSNQGSVSNLEDSHFNSNDNTNREGETPVERTICNSHTIPAKGGGEGTITCPP
jgi:hypothetical protein